MRQLSSSFLIPFPSFLLPASSPPHRSFLLSLAQHSEKHSDDNER